jgi:hypothetical protein
MPSVDRAAITRDLYRHLANPRFRRGLTAVAPDGTQPVTVALRSDPVSHFLRSITIHGGASNVVIPYLNGFVVFAIRTVDAKKSGDMPPTIKHDCTVGVFLAQLQVDHVRDGEEAVYHFAFEGPDRRETVGEAEVVAVAG